MHWLIILSLVLVAGGGGYFGYSRWGAGRGLGIAGTVVLLALAAYLVNELH
jgi:hypothetical protein